MAETFAPGDDLVFQLESGFGLLRVLAVDGEGAHRVWHLLAYDEFFPDVETAEAALANADLPVRKPHMALTERAFERTPQADPRAPRDAAFHDPARQHETLLPGRRPNPPRHAGVLSWSAQHRRSGQFRRGTDLRSVGIRE